MDKPQTNECTHSRDFKSVIWFGTEYRFSPQQAACVQVLWRAWLSGTPIIREEQVLESARVTARSLKDVFRTQPGLPAWGTMIGNGDRRGTVRLAEKAQDGIVKAQAALPEPGIQAPVLPLSPGLPGEGSKSGV